MPSASRILALEQKRKQKMKRKGKGKGGRSKLITDERFASAQSDPRFMEAPKRHSKVTIDSRFQGIFTDRNFTSSRAPVDKRGKPKDYTSTSITHYYRLNQQENDQQVDQESRAQVHKIDNQNLSESESEDDDVDVDRLSVDESSSTSSTDSDDDGDVGEEEEDTFKLQEDNIPEIDMETRRLAIVNLDWSQVRAVDLYVLLTSFLPKEGKIMSVSVYPSEFGLKRMEEEAIRGPVGLFDCEDEHDDVDDDEIDQNKLRAYELSRLRYYFAVVECDSVATSDYLYKTCDGVEFERSANKLDLRFIPDSMEFKHKPHDVATEAPVDYEGLDFQTRALQHSNIRLTWDEDEPQRAKTLKRKLNDELISELELKEYLASDESESDQDDDDNRVEDESEKKSKRDKYRALIQSGDDSNEDDDDGDNGQDMEVTFNSGLEEISKRIIEKKNKKSETVWEAYLRKKKEKKKTAKKGSKYSSDDESSDTDQDPAEQPDDFFLEDAPAGGNKGNSVQRKKAKKPSSETVQETEASRAELELLTTDDKWEDSNLKGYNLKPKKRKGKKGEAIPDEGKIPRVDIKEDPRFSALFTSSLYARDPTDPEFKRSAAYNIQKNAMKQKSTRTRGR